MAKEMGYWQSKGREQPSRDQGSYSKHNRIDLLACYASARLVSTSCHFTAAPDFRPLATEITCIGCTLHNSKDDFT
jgi:hypothetical protein